MTQTRPPPPPPLLKPRPSSSLSSSSCSMKQAPSPHLLLMELKHRALAALSKLADRDTQQIAMEELQKIVESLSPDTISVCLSCLYDTDLQQKSFVKKECVKLLGTLASLHPDLLPPHLPRIIACIVRRLKDPDTSVRDACVDSMGVLSSQMLCSATSGGAQESPVVPSSALATFVKPLFDALSEQNKSVQVGAAMCLARVIESAKDPPLAGMARLCPRICKILGNPNFLAKAALLPVIGSLSQVGAVNQQNLAMLIPSVHESLESNDWATRKAAAETLARMASNLGPTLASFKSSTVLVLESCRFDKVKPVRDSVQDATQLWKNLPSAETDASGKGTKNESGATESTGSIFTTRNSAARAPSPNPSETTPDSKVSATPTNSAEPMTDSQVPKSADRVPGIPKKRTPTLTDKKPNPDFFQKLEAQSSGDWQIEVAVPRSCLPYMSADDEFKGVDDAEPQQCIMGKERKVANGGNGLARSSSKNAEIYIHGVQSACVTRLGESNGTPNPAGSLIDNCGWDVDPSKRNQGVKDSKSRQMQENSWLEATLQHRDIENNSWDTGDHNTSSSSSGSYGEGPPGNGRGNWHFIQRQLSQLERQQSNLMDMLQEFMSSSQESMIALEARVRGLERIVEGMAQELALPSGRANGIMMGYEGGSVRSSVGYLSGSDYPSSKQGKESHASFTERLGSSEAMTSGIRAGRESSWRSEAGLEDWDGYAYANRAGILGNYLTSGQVGSRKNNVGTSTNIVRTAREDLGIEQVVSRKAWDRVSGSIRLGEGPSARSVWQASKDEATLAAIRVAGDDAGISEPETLSTEASRLIKPESGSEDLPYRSGGQGKGPFWSLWSHAMEFVHAGDMDSAYVEVLCSGDELLLVRLMNRTGPVLEQLSTNTASEMLHAVGQLLQQESFFDFSIPWIQQVADMVLNNGAECIVLSVEAKKELLVSLQEATGMDLPEGWLGNTVDQLLEQLASTWSIDLLQVRPDQ